MPRINRGHLLGLAAFLALPLAVFSSRGIATLYSVSAVLLLLHRIFFFRTPPQLPRWLVLWSCLFLTFAGASILWSVNPDQAGLKTLQLLGGTLAGLVLMDTALDLDNPERVTLRRALVAGMVMGLLLMAFETWSDALVTRLMLGMTHLQEVSWPTGTNVYFNHFKNAFTVAILMVWPAAIAAVGPWGRIAAWAIVAGVLALLLWFAYANTALVALCVGIVVFLLALARSRLVALVLPGVAVLALAVMPLIPPALPDPVEVVARMPGVNTSLHHRLVIWKFAAARIAEKPLWGWGVDAARDIPGGQARQVVDVPLPDLPPGHARRLVAEEQMLPLHTHNNFLQWWLELGVPGALLGAWLMVATARGAFRLRDADARAAAFAAMAVALTVANSSFGAFQNWWLGLLWLVAALLMAVAPPRAGLSGRN
ncbi:MAG: O-antigen ligase family protein [Alphaproteobacteria bacterium]